MGFYDGKQPPVTTRVDATFEGGGAKGLTYVGSLMALQMNGIWPARVAGTSAGAIVATLVAAGYTASELDYILSPEDLRPERPRELPASVDRIDLTTFQDLPSGPESFTDSEKRRTDIYQLATASVVTRVGSYLSRAGLLADEAITDAVVDELRRQLKRITIPSTTVEDLVRMIRAAIMGIEWVPDAALEPAADAAAEAVRDSAELINQLPRLPRQLRTEIVAALRQVTAPLDDALDDFFESFGPRTLGSVADAFGLEVTDEVLRQSPPHRYVAHLGIKAGLFEGRAALGTMRALISAKALQRGLIRDGSRPVTFEVLAGQRGTAQDGSEAIDLSLLATDTDGNRLQVFSARHTPEVEVALACRASMSIPGIWPPVTIDNRRFVDGGVLENDPFWFFLEGAEAHYDTRLSQDDEDRRRPKIAFSVTERFPAEVFPKGSFRWPPLPGRSGVRPGLDQSVRDLKAHLLDGAATAEIDAVAFLGAAAWGLNARGNVAASVSKALFAEHAGLDVVDVPVAPYSTHDFDAANTSLTFRDLLGRGWAAATLLLRQWEERADRAAAEESSATSGQSGLTISEHLHRGVRLAVPGGLLAEDRAARLISDSTAADFRELLAAGFRPPTAEEDNPYAIDPSEVTRRRRRRP